MHEIKRSDVAQRFSANVGSNAASIVILGSIHGHEQHEGGGCRGIGRSQAPNRLTTWSRNQEPREQAMSGPRFEQMDMSKQVIPFLFSNHDINGRLE